MTEKILNILLIEDNPDDQELMKEYLGSSKFSSAQLVIEANLESALQVLKKMVPDIVLLDLSLPDSFGLEGLKKICPEYPNLAIMILTGFNDPESALDAIKLGAQDFLVKGQFDEVLLERAIGYSIERNKLKIEVKESEAALRAKIIEIERANRLMVNRELKMIELKKEIKSLKLKI